MRSLDMGFGNIHKEFENFRNLAAFLVIILTEDGEMLADEALLIEKWIQCCMCSINSNEVYFLILF